MPVKIRTSASQRHKVLELGRAACGAYWSVDNTLEIGKSHGMPSVSHVGFVLMFSSYGLRRGRRPYNKVGIL